MPQDEETRCGICHCRGSDHQHAATHAGNATLSLVPTSLGPPLFPLDTACQSSSAQHARRATLPSAPLGSFREPEVLETRSSGEEKDEHGGVPVWFDHLTNPSPSLQTRDISTTLPFNSHPHTHKQHRKTNPPETSGRRYRPRGAWPWQTSVPRPRAKLRRHMPRPSLRYSSRLCPTLRASSGARPSRARCSSRDSERYAPMASAACKCERALPTCALTLVSDLSAYYVVARIAWLN
jgi:hypothetical protein